MNLRTPGPTPLPMTVREVLSRDMINHRSPEFAAMLKECTESLKTLFQTKNDLMILTSSGTGGLEASISNFFSPGDRVLTVSIGYFGDRWSAIAKAFGLDVVDLRYEEGQAADPQAIADKLRADPSIGAVLVTHNETSTGVTNDLESIAQVVKGAGRLFLVDGISSIGSIDLKTDDWGCDVVVSGSQKSWMSPPGIAIVSVSERAWEANKAAKCPRFYFDLTAAQKSAVNGETPWTPGVSTFYAIQEALRMLMQEGLENILARHHRVAEYTREGLKAIGMSLFPAEPARASDTVTAFLTPGGVPARTVQSRLRDDYDIEIAEGRGELASRMLRIGHLGWVREDDIKPVLEALRVVVADYGVAARA
jgi:aspartate aminotransferase-like enzyme